jgi:hypothetical protein
MTNLPTPAEVAELRRLAGAANAAVPGPWRYSGRNWRNEPTDAGWYLTGGHNGDSCIGVAIVLRNATSHPVCERLAAFMAAADPARVLALCDAADLLREVIAERDKLRERVQEVEYLRGNQLAAISTVLMSNTPVSLAAVRIPKSHALYTAAFQDAVRAVEREIALRSKLDSKE